MNKEKKYPSIARYKYYQLFGTPVKQLVMQFFANNGNKRYSLLELEKATEIPSSSLSPALVELKEFGLLESEKEGKYVFYSLSKEFARYFAEIYNKLDEVYQLALKNREVGKKKKE